MAKITKAIAAAAGATASTISIPFTPDDTPWHGSWRSTP
jgi:hypothetical protein